MSKVVDAKQFKDELLMLLSDEKIEAIPLRVTGNSMSPFLISNRDIVYLSKVLHELKKGDIVLYERNPGELVLHRIHSIKGNNMSLIGDGQFHLEHGVKKEQVIAKVSYAIRKNKKIGPQHMWWLFFEKIWISIIPFRKGIWTIVNKCRRKNHD